ncbi:hypothetical protein GGTG_12426 [Gaeumannomyces tritici R3-111a-1]|uniref:Uncharacterized protein n=1 Tax=Gaeumannomyces tritici (strain R3-111a-1) TaxID=644352 RepID=J3PG00_GAET3|nr:hypothetical protein GGTG_12426 [Gaeumannomyces tritici R3-111a-1]EJT70253.1 hypothetical protein GGTG_12426 [Gaeumannomyces tritici R3-111a-1]
MDGKYTKQGRVRRGEEGEEGEKSESVRGRVTFPQSGDLLDPEAGRLVCQV